MLISCHSPKHSTILILYVRVQLCQTILSMDNVEYRVEYAWLHYDVLRCRCARHKYFPEGQRSKAMSVGRDRPLQKYGYSEL